jgi:hypothetical protein
MHIFRLGLLSVVALAAVACGGGAAVTPTPAGPGSTNAPGATATPASATGAPGGSACRLVTQADADAALGAGATIAEEEDGSCNVTPAESIIPIVIRYGVNEDIATAKMIVDNGEDLTIGGSPAYYGELMGGILYIAKGGQTLVLQAPLSTESKDEMVALANLIITRFP